MALVAGRDSDELFRALAIELERVGADAVEICVIGGSALNLLGLIDRPTTDIDVVALAASRGSALRLIKADPLPETLVSAVAAVAHQFGIEEGWLNAGPANLIDTGLPDGFESRLIVRDFGWLRVHIAGRLDQICFKTYAAADVAGRHLMDLMALRATDDEMRLAFRWTRGQDPSAAFRVQLSALADYLGVRDVLDSLSR